MNNSTFRGNIHPNWGVTLQRSPSQFGHACCASDGKLGFAIVKASLIVAVAILMAAAGIAQALAPGANAHHTEIARYL